MKWFEEIKITRQPLDMIGMLFVVREVFANDCVMDVIEADSAFGPGWRTKAESLRKSGVLKVNFNGRKVTMKVVASGDKKREIMKNYARKTRREKGLTK